MRIAIDVNVLVAALTKPRGSAGEILRAWHRGQLEIVASNATLREAELVLSSAWLSRLATPGKAANLLKELRARTITVRGRRLPHIQLRDEGDLRLVEAAVAGNASYLVTSDRDLLRQRGYGSTRFVTPQELLRLLELRTSR